MKLILTLSLIIFSFQVFASNDSSKIEGISNKMGVLSSQYKVYDLPARHPRFMMIEMASQWLEISPREAARLVDYKWIGKAPVKDDTKSWGMMSHRGLRNYFSGLISEESNYTLKEVKWLKRQLAILNGSGARYGYSPGCIEKYQDCAPDAQKAQVLFLDTDAQKIYSFQF